LIYQQQKGSSCNFQGSRGKEGEKRPNSNKLDQYCRHALHRQEEDEATLSKTRRDGIFGHRKTLHALPKKHDHLSRDKEGAYFFFSIFFYFWSIPKVHHVN
jgi:hypothetical protein